MKLSCRNRGTCRWDHSLRTLLITGVLASWIPRASGQESPAGVITAKVGDTVTIAIPVTGEIVTYTWYRGTAAANEQAILTYTGAGRPPILGPQYTDRDTGLPDGSLQITDVLTNYTGNYTRSIVSLAEATTLTRQLRVYVTVPPLPPGSGLSGGAIAGIVVAVVVVLIAAIVSIWYFFFKRPASAPQKAEHRERNGASLSSNPNAPASGKANGPAEDVQYTTVKFAPKTEKVAMPAAPADTVYSEVRKK